MLYPAFSARNRILTRGLAETTKVKSNFINGTKKFKSLLSCLFGGRRKVQVTNLPSRASSLLSVQRLSSHHLVTVLTPSLVELVPSGFFFPQPWFLRRAEYIFPGNTRVYRNTVTCVTRVTSNRVEVHPLNSQHLAMVRTSNIAEVVPSGFFLSTTMVFAAVRTHFPKKNTRVDVNRAAINKQLF